jgi:hypothetical protein
MRQTTWRIVFGALLSAALLTACGPALFVPATPLPTATGDPCSPVNLPSETEKVSALLREFDDAFFVAQYTPSSLLPPRISDLQRIRREAEDLRVPACLTTLKTIELDYMNNVIVTLTLLLQPTPRADLINPGVAALAQRHNEFQIELARLLGVTLIAEPTRTPAPSATAGTSLPSTATTPTPAPSVSNPGPTTLNLRVRPALEANTMGVLEVGQSATLLGVTPDGFWYLIEIPGQPGQTAWIYAQLAVASVPITQVPAVTPAP